MKIAGFVLHEYLKEKNAPHKLRGIISLKAFKKTTAPLERCAAVKLQNKKMISLRK